MKGKNDQHKSCLIKLPKVSAASKFTEIGPPASPAASPNSTVKQMAAPLLPATATRCLSLVRYLTLVLEQHQAQLLQSGPETDSAAITAITGDHLSRVGSVVGAASRRVPMEVTSSSGSAGKSLSGSSLHVMSSLERRLASLTVQDATALVAVSSTRTASTFGDFEALSLPVSSELGADLSESVDGSPVVISAADLASGSFDPVGRAGAAEGLRESVLVSAADQANTPYTPSANSQEFPEEYVVV